jgi:hypothetical protein
MLTEWLKDLPVHFGCLYARECNRFVQCLLYNYTLLIYIMYFGVFVILLQDEAQHERPILLWRNIKRTLESDLVRRSASWLVEDTWATWKVPFWTWSRIPQDGARHERPILSWRNIKRTLESGLVRRSASWLVEDTWVTWKVLFRTWSHIKWKSIATCFILE